jgi:diguanylate cyclase (GGDEF)-like protein
MSVRSEFALSEGIQRQLVAKLFNQTTTLVVGGIALAFLAALCWARTGDGWFAIWAGCALAVLGGRIALESAFHHRRERADDIGVWRTRFIAGAWAMGALWGAGATPIIYHCGPVVTMFIITVTTAIVMGGAARNASSPLAARGQMILGSLPLFAALLTSGEPYYRAFGLFGVFALISGLTLIQTLYEHFVRFLTLDEEHVALVAEVRTANAELASANSMLELAATTDALTGVANRRQFDTVLIGEVRRARREQSDLALLFLDIDMFKDFNDLYGHQAGDECLQRVAAVLASFFRRPGDLVARYGGEEFAVILSQTNAASALALAESARLGVEGLAMRSGSVSVSIGVGSFVPSRFPRPEDFIRSADEAMYAAKNSGRNRVCLAADAA